MNVLIKGGHIVTPELVFDGDILISDGKIEKIGKQLSREGTDEVIDATGKLVFPGIIDEHVHMREPGLEYKDDFEHGTMAAAVGGVTTVAEMPNTIPPVDSRERIAEKAELLKKKATVDFALYGVLTDESVNKLEYMLKEGAIAFKAFLGPTTGNLPSPDNSTIYRALELSKKYDFPVVFHAEDSSLISLFTERMKSSGRNDPSAHLLSRPPITEEIAVAKIYMIAKETGGKAHVAHISSKGTLDFLLKAFEEGVRMTGETCPHYLYFDRSHYSTFGSKLKVNPPIREEEHRKALLEAIKSGVIYSVGSDHAPHSPEEKSRESIWDVPAGFIGVQLLLPSLLNLALDNLISLTDIPRLLSRNPAKLLGIWPMKGELIPGKSDGDIVIVDKNGETIVKEEWLITKSTITPFIGMKLKGKVEKTLLRGEI
ncbi:MAG: dihydroorotase family protein, partial [Fervidicoccaceae archaeon]